MKKRVGNREWGVFFYGIPFFFLPVPIFYQKIERDDLCVCFFKANWVLVQVVVGLMVGTIPIFLLDRAVIGSLQIKAALEAWNVLL